MSERHSLLRTFGAALLVISVSSCGVQDYFEDATKDECGAAAKHVVILHGGENSAVGAGAIEVFFPGAIGRFLSPLIDVCVLHASRHDVKCMVAAKSKEKLSECKFYTEHWRDK